MLKKITWQLETATTNLKLSEKTDYMELAHAGDERTGHRTHNQHEKPYHMQ